MMRQCRFPVVLAICGLVFMLAGCQQLSPHTVTSPSRPSGSSSGVTGQSLTFATGGASCSEGHPVQYRFDWGDGTYSSWSSSTSASKTWNSAGTRQVRAQARCAADTSVVSSWSSTRSVTITAPDYGGIGDTVDNGELAITLRSARTADSIGIWEPDPGLIYLIVDLRAEALRDGQYICGLFTLEIIQSDGRVRSSSVATYALDHSFDSANLDAGQWTDGEVAFEVSPGQDYYILEYDWIRVESIEFRFSP